MVEIEVLQRQRKRVTWLWRHKLCDSVGHGLTWPGSVAFELFAPLSIFQSAKFSQKSLCLAYNIRTIHAAALPRYIRVIASGDHDALNRLSEMKWSSNDNTYEVNC